MKQKLTILFLMLLIAVSSFFAGYTTRDRQEIITEDDPRWDCHTMGNRICGKEQE